MEVNLLDIDWDEKTNGYTFAGIEAAVRRYPLEHQLAVLAVIKTRADASLPSEFQHRRANNERLCFAPLRSRIQAEILQKEKSDRERAKFTITLNGAPNKCPDAVDTTESDSAVTYKYDPGKVNKVHDFCIGDVFTGVEPHMFAGCVASADFSKIYHAVKTKKTKFRYIVYVLSHVITDADQITNWYRAAAGSIGLIPQKCSSANVPDDWKSSANALK